MTLCADILPCVTTQTQLVCILELNLDSFIHILHPDVQTACVHLLSMHGGKPTALVLVVSRL